MTCTEQAGIVEMLRDRHTYPHVADRVDVEETHGSWVFLAGAYVYKLKKAVDLGFLDYSTAAKRRLCCEAEVRLNRRLAPEIYLDVIAVRDVDGKPRIDFEQNLPGKEIDTLVRMKRIPPESILNARLAAGDVTDDEIRLLVDRLAQFYDCLLYTSPSPRD